MASSDTTQPLTSHSSAAVALDRYGTAPLAQHDDVPLAPQPPASRVAPGLAAAAQRDIGQRRTSNQDQVLSLLTSLPRDGRTVPLGLFVVADGMGGHDGGEVASRLAVRTVARYVIEHMLLPGLDEAFADDLQHLLTAAVQTANADIYSYARGIGSDMGTTCSVALLLGNALAIAHVGDSRVYVRSHDELHVLSDDHSAVGRLIQLGQITPAEAREHDLRGQLYRTVGQNPQISVDYRYQPLVGASHVLLCSDGLWGMVDDDAINAALRDSCNPQDACERLIARANAAGGDDNIGVVVVTLPATAKDG
jgi:PPM family protein phosphatase